MPAEGSEPGDSVFLRRRRVSGISESPICFRGGKAPEEPLEPSWRVDQEHSTNPRIDTPLRMGYTARRKDPLSRPEAVLFLPDENRMFPFDDVEVLVLVRVDVSRRVEKRRQLLDHGERATGHLGGGTDGDRQSAEPEDLAPRGLHDCDITAPERSRSGARFIAPRTGALREQFGASHFPKTGHNRLAPRFVALQEWR